MPSPRPTLHCPIIVIPARMASRRLPGKPLIDLHGEPMIVHVWRRAIACDIGPVVVACDGDEIAAAIEKVGGKAIVTRRDHPSGSDRVWEALCALEGSRAYDAVINVQGDLPVIDPAAIIRSYELLRDTDVDIGTLAVKIRSDAEKNAPQVIKAVIDLKIDENQGRALYFSRLPVPSGEGPTYHHVGLYAYRRESLAEFVNAPPSPLELRESLEQLRALSLGMRIEVAVIDTVPLGVDTPDDLEEARRLLKQS